MAKKSNKTAHVLNLISSAKPVSESKEEVKEEPQETAAPIQVESVTQVEPSSIQTSLSQNTKNEELAEKIHDNLLAELENNLSVSKNDDVQSSISTPSEKDLLSSDIETKENIVEEEIESSPSVENKSEDISSSTSSDAKGNTTEIENIALQQDTTMHTDAIPDTEKNASDAQNIAIQQAANNENISSDAEQPLSNQTTPIAVDISDSSDNTSMENTDSSLSESSVTDDTLTTPPHFVFVNICEELVKEKTVEYLERFGVCTCSRCVADAMALALTNIQPKYVVMDPDTAVPFLSYYANKLSINVMTELTKACLTVLAHPRHDPEEAKLELECKAKKQADSKNKVSEN